LLTIPAYFFPDLHACAVLLTYTVAGENGSAWTGAAGMTF